VRAIVVLFLFLFLMKKKGMRQTFPRTESTLDLGFLEKERIRLRFRRLILEGKRSFIQLISSS
jgi:hypothetical protein